MFHYVHFTVSSFVFHYFISYGKIVLQPISYAAKKKICLQKILMVKLPRTNNSRMCFEKFGFEDQERNNE